MPKNRTHKELRRQWFDTHLRFPNERQQEPHKLPEIQVRAVRSKKIRQSAIRIQPWPQNRPAVRRARRVWTRAKAGRRLAQKEPKHPAEARYAYGRCWGSAFRRPRLATSL